MKALIIPTEKIYNGVRIAQVESNTSIFEVAEPLYWVDCPDDCEQSSWYYDEIKGECIKYSANIPTAEQNKQTAISLLKLTDWATYADVADKNVSNPYLANQSEFFAYRNLVRQYAINPVAGDITFPDIPNEVWASI